jgi:hypothetical protein
MVIKLADCALCGGSGLVMGGDEYQQCPGCRLRAIHTTASGARSAVEPHPGVDAAPGQPPSGVAIHAPATVLVPPGDGAPATTTRMRGAWPGSPITAPSLSAWEARELAAESRKLARLPRGERGPAERALANQYGVCTRTVQRWRLRQFETVVLGQWEAIFASTGRKAPRQVTPWSLR